MVKESRRAFFQRLNWFLTKFLCSINDGKKHKYYDRLRTHYILKQYAKIKGFYKTQDETHATYKNLK